MEPQTIALKRATAGLSANQKSKIADAVQPIANRASNAMGKLKAMQESLPVRTGLQSVGTVATAFSAGATDAAAEAVGLNLPYGIRPSMITGVFATAGAIAGVFMGEPLVVDIAAPIAAGNLAAHAYGLGYGAVGRIQQATAQTTQQAA